MFFYLILPIIIFGGANFGFVLLRFAEGKSWKDCWLNIMATAICLAAIVALCLNRSAY